ncbi:MAG: type III pantothenate kinase [Clostridium fessum]
MKSPARSSVPVVPPVTSLMREAIRKVTGQEALVVNVDMNIGLEVLMDNPSSVGTDLIVGAVAGINRYPVPLILIDMGTATTICVVNENKQYIGGMILPGIGVSMNSLTSRTAQLPRISLDPPKRLIGKNTVECMQSGALYGNASCIDGMVDRIQEELGQEATIVADGRTGEADHSRCAVTASSWMMSCCCGGFGLFTRRINKVCDSDMKKAVGESLTAFYCIG